jgi:AraC-like DNA-binding protein
MDSLFHEITPLNRTDCFVLAMRVKSDFQFPLHYHDEYELNFIMHARGAQRVIGDHIGEIDDLELVLVGSNLQHAWFNHHMESSDILEITIQFHKDLFSDKFLGRNQMSFIRNMLDKSGQGILFSQKTIRQIMPRIVELNRKLGFDSVLEFMSVLHDLSVSPDMHLLSDSTFNNQRQLCYNSRRIEKAMEYMDHHFDKPINLADVAALTHMTETAFSRFFRSQTGRTFVDVLTEKRLGHVSRLLIESSLPIADIADHCGFNNMANFNRVFKRKKGFTPKEFREVYSNISQVFI